MRVGRTKVSYIDDRHFWDDVSFVCLFASLLIYRPSREKGDWRVWVEKCDGGPDGGVWRDTAGGGQGSGREWNVNNWNNDEACSTTLPANSTVPLPPPPWFLVPSPAPPPAATKQHHEYANAIHPLQSMRN